MVKTNKYVTKKENTTFGATEYFENLLSLNVSANKHAGVIEKVLKMIEES